MRQFAADIVIIEKGKVLLALRDTEPFKGMWTIPGGRIDENETIEECAIREAKEETGLDVELGNLIRIYSNPSRDPRKTIAAAYFAKVKGGKLIPQPGEVKELRWFRLDKLPQLGFDHAEIIQDAMKMMKIGF